MRFENVTFGYANSPSPAVIDVNLVAPRGKSLAIVGRNGTVTSVVDDSALETTASSGLRLSPDAGSIVAVIQSAPNTSDLWIYDLSRGARTKLTDHGPVNATPIWSPDGKQIAFNSTREPAGVYRGLFREQSAHGPGSVDPHA